MVCVIGGGKLGSVIAEGLLAADPEREVVIAVKKGADTSVLKRRIPQARVVDHPEASDGVILAVKPKDIGNAGQLAARCGATRVLSVAAGVTLKRLSEVCGDGVAVFRSMPNVAAQVQRSATAFCTSEAASDDDVAWVLSVLEPLGKVVRVDERDMNAVTGVSGSGIAFVLLVLEALAEAGVEAGLDEQVAHALAVATFDGAVALASGDESPAQIRARVATPGGTTEAGLAVLEERGVRDLFEAAVEAARSRAAEIGRSL